MECKYTETDEGYDGTKLHFISEWEGRITVVTIIAL